MSQIFVFGRVTADFQLQQSTKKTSYVRFDLAESIGYGETKHTQYYQVWAWAEDAIHLTKRHVKKGSLLWLSGSLLLEEYTKKDGVTRDKRMKVILDNWGFVPGSKASPAANAITKETGAIPSHDLPAAVAQIDGDREALPD